MSFAALALRARAANDTTRAQINNIPSKSHVIPLITCCILQLGLVTDGQSANHQAAAILEPAGRVGIGVRNVGHVGGPNNPLEIIFYFMQIISFFS